MKGTIGETISRYTIPETLHDGAATLIQNAQDTRRKRTVALNGRRRNQSKK